jgi:hypothetical protein
VLREAKSTEARINLAFISVVGRSPRPQEMQVLLHGLERHREHYRGNEVAARKLISIGTAPRDPKLDVRELAAYTAITSLILNLDEVITRE